MTQDPHHSSWDAPAGEQPVEPSAAGGPVHRDTGGWARPSWPPQQLASPQTPPVPPVPPAYGPPAYGPPGHGYAGVPAPAAPRGQAPTSAIVLVVLSGLLALGLFWTVVGLLYVAPAVLSVVALARSGSDPAGARRTSRTGWIVFGAVTVVLGLLVVVAAVLLSTYGFSEGGGSSGASGVSV